MVRHSSVNGVSSNDPIETLARQLLTLIKQFEDELSGGRGQLDNLGLDSSLDRDLGLDSLALAELISRVEQSFGVTLSEQTLSRAETPRDLLREIMREQPSAAARKNDVEAGQSTTDDTSWRDKAVKDLSLPAAEPAPIHVQTLPEVLAWHVDAHPDRTHIYLYDDAEQVSEISYADLYSGATKIAAGLLDKNAQAGQTVALMLPTSRDYFLSYFGILLIGCVPVPIYPPARPSQLEDHLRRHSHILNNAQVKFLLTVAEAKHIAQLLKAQVPSLSGVFAVDELCGNDAAMPTEFSSTVRSLDTAFLQYTSGSTGTPKGVILSHANLLANIRAMGSVMQADSTDVFVSWLPLYHDMGLIASWLTCLYYAMPFVSMSPLQFLSRPQRWLRVIHKHRGSLSAAPNFAYELCLKKIQDADIEGLDLSCWRAAFNGAEAVSPSTMRRFTERFSDYGFRPNAMVPVYGLAESSVGLTLPPLGREPVVDHIDRTCFMSSGTAQSVVPVDQGESKNTALEFVALGLPLPEHEIRVVDDAGLELPERREGILQFRGPSATSGYFRNAQASQQLFRGDWLNSGDRAYIAGGELFITGRSKDIIIRAGRNLYPHELEEGVSAVAGIRKGCVAVFASKDPRTGTERLVVLAETREIEPVELERVRRAIRNLSVELMGTPPDDIVLAPPHSVLKTSSGKIRRAASREIYEQGKIGAAHRAVWLQLFRVAAMAVKPQILRAQRQAIELSYALYCWLLLLVIAPISWLLVSYLLPKSLVQHFLRGAANIWISLSATKVQLVGLENLGTKGNQIIVANHGSYLDGLVLLAKLPIAYSFVAKAELTKSFFIRRFLSRLDTEFVERFDLQKGVANARALAGKAEAGKTLLFFPEGTFTRAPGLRAFHMGAFVAACDANAAVVPISLRGMRSKMRGNIFFPRRGAISVTIGSPITTEGSDWATAVNLRDRARKEILRHCGEPDIAQDNVRR